MNTYSLSYHSLHRYLQPKSILHTLTPAGPQGRICADGNIGHNRQCRIRFLRSNADYCISYQASLFTTQTCAIRAEGYGDYKDFPARPLRANVQFGFGSIGCHW